MKSLTRFLLPVIVLLFLAASVVGVAFARESKDVDASRSFLNEYEMTGAVESITPQAWVVDGVTLVVTSRTEIKGDIQVGQVVKVHLYEGLNGNLTAREIELSLGAGDDDNGNDNSGDDDNGNDNSGDDNGNDNAWDDDDNGNDNSWDDDNGNDNSGDDDDNDNDDDDDGDDDDDNDNDDDDDDDDDNDNED